MEILIAIAAKIADYMVRPVGRWLCYSFHYSSNIGSMQNQVEKLRLARERVQHSIDAARNNGEEIEGDVKKWLEDVDKTIEKAMKVLESEKEARTKGSNGACMNLKVRHQLSHKAAKIVEDIGEGLRNGSFDRVSYHPAPQGILTTRSMDYVDFESRISTVKRLMEALRDDNIHMIGVWGMAGVGKTTLVREVAKQAKEAELFDEVAIANVTHSPDFRRIQGEIADMLDLKFDKETVRGRASILWERLSQDRKKPVIPDNILENLGLEERLTKTKDKKILVILDDIWENFDLEEIGIPSGGCKLLLTSRNREVLFCGMRTQKNFGLDVLCEQEAWSLFEKMVGDCVKDPILRCTTTEVAKACAGLPLALVTVFKALKNKRLYEWKNALQQLRTPTSGHHTRMHSTIHSSIELSYKHLESKEVQDVFLLCAQLAYYIDERYLLRYCYGLNLFHGINTMEDARNRVLTIVRILKDCCLLLHSHDSYSSEILCMHDVVRCAATLIASRDHNMFVMRTDGGLREWPNADALKGCRAFSVLGGDFRELPTKMECPELRLLCLYCDDLPLQISNTFFEGMRELKVLDLSKMQLSSLRLLRNLQTLCLCECVLGDIAIIGELKNLAIFSLNKSHILQLPREIGLLTRLRLLDLSDCSKLEVIPPNVLSSLVALEELYMGNSFVNWEAEGLNNERNNANLAELKHLSQLITLEIHIRDASNLPKDLSFEKLERYVILIGDVWDWPDRRGEASRTLKLKLNTSFQSKVEIKMLLKRTENLHLDELKGVTSVINELDREGFQQLKHLHIQNNAEIMCIINSRMLDIAFPALETILLKNMISLEEICHGQLPLTISFGNLRVVKVEYCDKLKFVFSSSIARGLPRLEELEIRKCSNMGAIVMKEDGEIEEEHTFLFPQLHHLALEHLPKLMSFLSTQNSLAGEIISEGRPDFHMPILQEQVVFPNLEMLELSSIGLEDIQHNQHRATWFSCKLENMQSTLRFQNLSYLVVKGSGNIKYLLSFSTATFMVQLKDLHILKCKVMEEILVTEDFGVVEEIIPKVLFPRLEVLFLQELPILKTFCEGSDIKFPSLKELWIEHCPKLKTFISKPVSLGMKINKELKEINTDESSHTVVQPLFNEEVAFPSLESLTISHMDDLKIIWRNQVAVDSFYMLQSLVVEFCENLRNVFQSDMLARFQSLEELILSDCGSLQEVFEMKGLNVIETHAVTTIQLKKLYLARLPKMKHVWNKDPKGFFSFQHLKLIHAMRCECLKNFFPASVARCLMQLEKLHIADCGVEEIVAGEEGAEGEKAITRFVFPQVINLCLDHLPRLKWFYPGRHASEWPMLKDMLVGGNHEIEIFASELLSETLEESQLEISAKQPFFLVDEVVFPNLERLELSSIGLEDIQHNQHWATRSSCRLDNMQSASRFQNLSHLVVKGSSNIKYLLSFSTAKFMLQLKNLHILECEVLEEILVIEDFVVEEIIPKVLFPRLEVLILEKLPILKRFCEGSNIRFPSLKELVIEHCPKLKTFISKPVSLGMATSYKELQEMNAEESPHTAVQPLFNEEVAFPSLECLTISHLDDLKIIWRNQFAVDSFCKLHRINVEFCENLTNVFQSDMLTRFQSLETLIVNDCGSLEEVFELEGLNIIETHAVTTIQLKVLNLARLPNMRHVWSKDPKPIFSFQNLQRVHVVRCWSLKSLFPTSVATCLMQLEQLVIVGCKILEEIVAGEEADQQPIARFVFPQVTVMHLAVLPRLKWFYQGVHTSEWPMLKDMLVACCRKVEIFASELLSFEDMLRESQLEIPIKQPLFLVDQVPFPSLGILRIASMLNLKIIWHNQFTADSFCKPPEMKVEFCENIIVQETCSVKATQLKELYLIHLPKLKHIWNKDPREIFSCQNPLKVHAEEDFSSIQEIESDDNGVKKIAVSGLKSSVFPQSQKYILQIGRC